MVGLLDGYRWKLNVWWGLMSYDIEENGCVQIKTISSICLKRLISSHLLQKI
jgi:hypothetical protein